MLDETLVLLNFLVLLPSVVNYTTFPFSYVTLYFYSRLIQYHCISELRTSHIIIYCIYLNKIMVYIIYFKITFTTWWKVLNFFQKNSSIKLQCIVHTYIHLISDMPANMLPTGHGTSITSHCEFALSWYCNFLIIIFYVILFYNYIAL